MNKEFWDNMAKLWCVSSSSFDITKIMNLAKEQAISSKSYKAGYSVNPLDDEDEEDDEWV